MADTDLDSGCLLNKKIRHAQLAQYNFILGEISVLLHHCLSFAFAYFKNSIFTILASFRCLLC